MSWTDEELDGLVRDAANSNHVEYKETYWHEMEAMLGAEKSSKIGMWWWMQMVCLDRKSKWLQLQVLLKMRN